MLDVNKREEELEEEGGGKKVVCNIHFQKSHCQILELKLNILFKIKKQFPYSKDRGRKKLRHQQR